MFNSGDLTASQGLVYCCHYSGRSKCCICVQKAPDILLSLAEASFFWYLISDFFYSRDQCPFIDHSIASPDHCFWLSAVQSTSPIFMCSQSVWNQISPDFSLELTRLFPEKHLILFLVLMIKDFRNFVLHNCILVFDAEQVYLKLQVPISRIRKL